MFILCIIIVKNTTNLTILQFFLNFSDAQKTCKRQRAYNLNTHTNGLCHF